MFKNPLSTPGENSAERQQADARVVGLLLLLAVLPYVNTLVNGFVFDDYKQLLGNPLVHNPRYLPDLLTTTVWAFEGQEGVLSYYRPMMTVTYLVSWQLFGPIPFGYHLMNIVWHAAVVCLLFFVTRRLFRCSAVAFLSAALFAIHPIHSEPVAWIAGIADLQLTFLYLLAFWFFLSSTQHTSIKIRTRILATGGLALALLSKEPAITFPVLAAIYTAFYQHDRASHTRISRIFAKQHLPLWCVAAAYLVVRGLVVAGGWSVAQRDGLSILEQLLSTVALVGQYMTKLVWPAKLAFFYPFTKSKSPFDLHFLTGSAILLICAAVFVWLWKHHRPASFGFVWIFLTLAPVLNIRWMVTNVLAERYLYLPSVGFCWLAGFAVVRLWSACRTRAAWRLAIATALSLVILVSVVRIVIRNRDWQSQERFTARELAQASDPRFVRANSALVHAARGDDLATESALLQALRAKPNNELALYQLGLLRSRQKRYPEAIEALQKTIAAHPAKTSAHLALGGIYLELGRVQEAEECYRNAIRLAPLSTQARNHLGRLLFGAGRFSEAEVEFQQSIEIEPTAEACARLGDLYLRLGSSKQAEESYEQAISLEPFDSHSHFQLGALHEASGRLPEAIRHYEAGLRTNPQNDQALSAITRLRAHDDHGARAQENSATTSGDNP